LETKDQELKPVAKEPWLDNERKICIVGMIFTIALGLFCWYITNGGGGVDLSSLNRILPEVPVTPTTEYARLPSGEPSLLDVEAYDNYKPPVVSTDTGSTTSEH
jgi:hypothetical protein